MKAISERAWRYLARTLFGIAAVISLLCVGLVIAAVRNDSAITENTGHANAEIVSVGFDRTIIRFETPDGVVRLPPNGVLYPEGLNEGQLVRIEYDAGDPELARVAGRTAALSLLPLGMTVGITWLIAGPALWFIQRQRHTLRREHTSAERQEPVEA